MTTGNFDNIVNKQGNLCISDIESGCQADVIFLSERLIGQCAHTAINLHKATLEKLSIERNIEYKECYSQRY